MPLNCIQNNLIWLHFAVTQKKVPCGEEYALRVADTYSHFDYCDALFNSQNWPLEYYEKFPTQEDRLLRCPPNCQFRITKQVNQQKPEVVPTQLILQHYRPKKHLLDSTIAYLKASLKVTLQS